MCEPLRPQYPCSAHGVCLNEHYCVCNQGWSSLGDMSVIEGYDCAIYLPAIRIASVIVLCSSSVSFLLCINYFGRQMNADRIWSIVDPKLLFPLCYFFSCILEIIFAALKLRNTEYYIVGSSVFITFTLSLHCLCVFAGLFFFLQICMDLLSALSRIMNISSQIRFKSVISLFKNRIIYFNVSNVLIQSTLVIGLLIPKEKYYIVGMVWYGLLSLFLTLFLLMFIPTINLIIDELHASIVNMESYNHHIVNDPVKNTLFLLTIAKYSLIAILSNFVIFCLFFSVWKFLIFKTVYLSMAYMLAAQLPKLALLFSVSRYKPSSTKRSLFSYLSKSMTKSVNRLIGRPNHDFLSGYVSTKMQVRKVKKTKDTAFNNHMSIALPPIIIDSNKVVPFEHDHCVETLASPVL